MENASKALLMAAGVLIGIMVLSLAVYLYANFSQIYADMNAQNESQKLAQFNTQYTVYEHRTDLTIYDILTIISYAKENNQNLKDENGVVYSGEEENIISVTLKRGGSTIQNAQEKNKNDLNAIIKEDQSNLQEDATGKMVLPTYTCKTIGYNSKGRVKSITIQKN